MSTSFWYPSSLRKPKRTKLSTGSYSDLPGMSLLTHGVLDHHGMSLRGVATQISRRVSNILILMMTFTFQIVGPSRHPMISGIKGHEFLAARSLKLCLLHEIFTFKSSLLWLSRIWPSPSNLDRWFSHFYGICGDVPSRSKCLQVYNNIDTIQKWYSKNPLKTKEHVYLIEFLRFLRNIFLKLVWIWINKGED